MSPVVEAVELFKEEGKPIVIISKFETDHVSVCTEVDGVKRCYVTSRPSPEIYYIAQSFYSAMGLKTRRIL